MCACRQKKTPFFIEDILKDTKNINTNINHGPKELLSCKGSKVAPNINDQRSRFSGVTEVRRELDLEKIKINLDQRRNTYPFYPTPIKPTVSWQRYNNIKENNRGLDIRNTFSFYSEPMLNADHLLNNGLSANRFVPRPYSVRQGYGFDRALPATCYGPWWSVSGRRKGGQVRFSAVQTSALERRFGASKYLSPDERRSLAVSLRLSDRQVKTWFQNRRAKWRRTVPDDAASISPQTNDEVSDDEIQIADEESFK